ncbi:MFS transporter [Nocardioides alkalitolerans]|uniref:MFS transporter n=1 Tax=Nocardioides alkalitolerans TaxID=281714 RepID=UPI0003F6022E|nr:MFS transporter [Nocardioides alkalitolerans]
MRRIIEVVAPARLGTGFRRLLGAYWTANVGDGIMLAAGPLLIAWLTDEAFLIALAAAVQRAPWLLVGLYAGVVADRFDRRRIILVTNTVRLLAVAVLLAAVATDLVTVAGVLAALFVLGLAECFNDTTMATLMPMLVPKKDLGLAGSRVMVGVMTINQLAGPPVGAALFVAGTAWPLAAQVVCLGLVLVQLARLRLPPVRRDAPLPGARTGVWHEVREGIGWLAGHAAVRTLALTILMFNVTFGATWSVLVIYTHDRLGLGEIGFGLVTAATAVGGITGALLYGTLERRFPLGSIMRVGLVVETSTHAVLALTTSPAVALAILFAFGVQASVWGTTSTAVRQRAVPAHFQGRVTSVYLIGMQAGLVVGAVLGGVLAQVGDVRTTLWFGFVGSAVILVLIWRVLPQIAHAGTDDED